MASGDKTPSRIPGPKSGMTQSKPVAEQSVVSGDESLLDLRDFDWSQLESNYVQMMEQHEKSEEELRNHITNLLQVFTAWSQTTVEHDETRALKRFRTQMHHVQNSEESLEKKRRHYMNVVKAFESALALLNDRIRP
ncbi:uncharacterized protein DSM5745_05356 [Aspergillus mulundensis]|uniref:Uncharacterized protein n=1 Tax=Aspergillus mulundensis TaxID=1810919 RepID=A0A3D8S671_9EURO|nr:Uncharacterized protein DSM5745_05356 [Aspergillus mulundensis]RDW81799.1 Uncharacterized protein DSM5745_05356 [Aspergillus mulundensis]